MPTSPAVKAPLANLPGILLIPLAALPSLPVIAPRPKRFSVYSTAPANAVAVSPLPISAPVSLRSSITDCLARSPMISPPSIPKPVAAKPRCVPTLLVMVLVASFNRASVTTFSVVLTASLSASLVTRELMRLPTAFLPNILVPPAMMPAPVSMVASWEDT